MALKLIIFSLILTSINDPKNNIIITAVCITLVAFFSATQDIIIDAYRIESVDQNSNKIHESADVIYHLMVYLEANNIKIEDVMSELKKRQK